MEVVGIKLVKYRAQQSDIKVTLELDFIELKAITNSGVGGWDDGVDYTGEVALIFGLRTLLETLEAIVAALPE